MTILVTGGTGHLGREVVRVALTAGHAVRIMVLHAIHEGPRGLLPDAAHSY